MMGLNGCCNVSGWVDDGSWWVLKCVWVCAVICLGRWKMGLGGCCYVSGWVL
jgi:hypothetical protein